MTEQLFVFTCRDVHRLAFDWRKGELEASDRKKFDAHLSGCAECQDYVQRLGGMLDSARDHEAGADIDPDGLFDRIMAEVDETTPSSSPSDDEDAPVVRLERFQPQDVDEEDSPQPSRPRVRWSVVAAALAAGILIGLAIPYLLGGRIENEGAGVGEPGIAERSEEPKEVPVSDEAFPAPLDLALLASQPTPEAMHDVRIFGDASAEWSLRDTKQPTVELRSGVVLVEFVPESKRSLTFVTEDFTVRVIGTVFYVSAEEDLVGVVTGEVEVVTSDGKAVRLRDGQEMRIGEEVRPIAPERLEDAGRHIAVERHRERVAALRRASDAPKASNQSSESPREAADVERREARTEISEEVAAVPTRDLKAEARQALKQGRYDLAAQYYERMVVELPATDPAHASMRLDLARIYLDHLERPRQAVRHLRRFVEDRPRDPATPSAREKLCALLDELGQRDPACASMP